LESKDHAKEMGGSFLAEKRKVPLGQRKKRHDGVWSTGLFRPICLVFGNRGASCWECYNMPSHF